MNKSPNKPKAAQEKKTLVPEVQNAMPDLNAINERLALVGVEVYRAFDNLDFTLAKSLLEKEVLPHAPQHPIALNDLAIAERNLGNHEQAYNLAIHALNFAQEQHLPDIYDNLASICYRRNRFEESKYFGRLAIFIKKEMIKDITPNTLPKRKKKGLHADKTKNIIAFSLSGSDPRQCETAVLNASLAASLYPNWTCRFYVDENVPEHTFDRLNQHGAQIIKCTPNKHIPISLRHFAVMSDNDVHIFLLRNVDSLLSSKEKEAVKMWLESKQYFHIMRDFYEQTELVLPSMWGGYTGAFDDIEQQMTEFFAQNNIGRTTMLTFLRTKIYPTLNQSLISHDDLHLDPDSHAYPSYQLTDVEKIPYFHIGLSDAFISTTSITLDEPLTKIEWYLTTTNNEVICYYTEQSQVIDGITKVNLNLPYFYSQNIANKQWQIHYKQA